MPATSQEDCPHDDDDALHLHQVLLQPAFDYQSLKLSMAPLVRRRLRLPRQSKRLVLEPDERQVGKKLMLKQKQN